MPSDRKFQKSRTSDFENFLLSISKILNFLGIETEINLLAVFVKKLPPAHSQNKVQFEIYLRLRLRLRRKSTLSFTLIVMVSS